MKKYIFAQVNDSFFETHLVNSDDVPSCPAGFIVMLDERPDINYIAKDNGDGTGSWIIEQELKPTNEEIIANNKLIKQSLITEATLQISILQDAIDLDIAQDGDNVKLKEWKKYRILLTRIDISKMDVCWPEKPFLKG